MNIAVSYQATTMEIKLPLEYRKEKIFNVKPAVSIKNIFSGITMPQNPGLADNNFNSAHQDSYCTESVGLTGPTSKTLKLTTQYHPYGMFGVMACNSNNQMISTGVWKEHNLVVFDADCHIISATKFGAISGLSFSGGYFYLDNNNNAIVITSSNLICFPTAHVERKSDVYPLEPVWSSDDIVSMVTGCATGNLLYSAFPVWGQTNRYWCILSGDYNIQSGTLNSNAFVAVVEIIPDPTRQNKCKTKVLGKKELPNQWNNNSIAGDEEGLYVVTNKMDNATTPAKTGCLHKFLFNKNTKVLTTAWVHDYESCGYLLVGQTNIGSGTTPTLTTTEDGVKCVSITDNAAPQVNVVTVNRSCGVLISKTPVFTKKRSGNEASLIGVKDTIIVENNYGHTLDFPYPQYISNEPGMACMKIKEPSLEIEWENSVTTFFGMSMLARESGIIFGFTGSWYDSNASTVGPQYSVVALDAFSGRIIWRIPVGRGVEYCHEYGGFYFNRTGNSIYVGANNYIVCIKDVEERNVRVSTEHHCCNRQCTAACD